MQSSPPPRVKTFSGKNEGCFSKLALVPRFSARAAFSLVEVVLALGICVFAVLPVVGLLPMALRSAKEATDTTQQSKIIQRVANELLQTPFAQLPSRLSDRQFDYDGTEVEIGGDVYYTAGVSLADLSLPGATDTSAKIYRVAINVTARGRGDLKTMAITIADTGY